MQMFLQIHLWSCLAVFEHSPLWEAVIMDIHFLLCPEAHCFLSDGMGPIHVGFVAIPCRKWFLLFLLWDHLGIRSNPLDSHSCPNCKEDQSSLPTLDSAGLGAACGLPLEVYGMGSSIGSLPGTVWAADVFLAYSPSENFCEVIFNIFECSNCAKRYLCHKGKSLSIPPKIWRRSLHFLKTWVRGSVWNWLWGVLGRRPYQWAYNAPPFTVAASVPWPRQSIQLATWGLKAASRALAEIWPPETVSREIFSQSGEPISSVFLHSFSESCCGFRNPPNPSTDSTLSGQCFHQFHGDHSISLVLQFFWDPIKQST